MIKGNNGHLYYSNEKQEIVISTPGGTKNEYEIEVRVSKQRSERRDALLLSNLQEFVDGNYVVEFI